MMKGIETFSDEKASEFLEWITKHKIYTITLLILIIFGLGKLVRHFGDKK